MLPKLSRFILPRTRDQSIFLLMMLVFFFWTLFDGTVSYVTPIIISNRGISGTVLGLILGSASLLGIPFDFFMSQLLPHTNFRRVFLAVFMLSLMLPIILITSTSIIWFLVAMAIWAAYYNLFRVGTYDFISRRPSEEEHAMGFGVVHVFSSLGYLLAPMIAVFLIGYGITRAPIVAAYLFLAIAVVLFLQVLIYSRSITRYHHNEKRRSLSVFREVALWLKLEKKMRPVLILTFMINAVFAFYFTIGPLFAEKLTDLGPFAGIFMASLELPMLVAGWVVGHVALRYGKKRTAIGAFFVGSLILVSLGFIHNQFLLVFVNLIAAFFISLALPALNGTFADFIAEAQHIAIEVETMEDMSDNTAYLVGPILAGVVSDLIGYQLAFSILGVCGVLVAIYLYRVTPRHINVAPLVR